MTKSATAARLDIPMPRVAKKPAQIVTAAELLELADLEEQYAELCRTQADIERKTKAARLSLAQKVLGVESAEQFKALDPETLERLMIVRQEKGFWKIERRAPPFLFVKTSAGRYPAWRDEFIKLASEAEAEKITAETDKTYSYRVDVAR